MGRQRTQNFHLPKYVTAYHGAYYYRGPATQWARTHLGRDLDAALARYARIYEGAGVPEPELRPGERYVYIVGVAGEDLPVKIGIASDMNKRLCGLQSSHPRRLEVRGMYLFGPAARAREIEELAHEKFAGYALRGEWFNVRAREVSMWIEGAFHAEMLSVYRPKSGRFGHMTPYLVTTTG